ncbi:MAG: RNase adapter RapZ [Myxococcales bacterium]|nr:RNase adapter RapZ [Myxococcales bacterium]
MIRHLVVITGMSGSGKSIAAKTLEDSGYFCVDNLPFPLLPSLLETLEARHDNLERIAVVTDTRQPGFGGHEAQVLRGIFKQLRYEARLLFLDSQDDILARRYAESRRPHPMDHRTVAEGIRRERALLAEFREEADIVLDTSLLEPRQLRQRLRDAFGEQVGESRLRISVLSFGFKYGPPMDADMLFDVRFLPNPYWVESLRARTGEENEVIEFLEKQEATPTFLSQLRSMLAFVLPQYQNSDRHYLTIAIGCTGGQHRSVYIARTLQSYLQDLGTPAFLMHRDIRR